MRYLCILIMSTSNDENATKHDIDSIDDIRLLVDDFYVDVRKNPVIGPIFIGAIRDHWPQHIETMILFWQTVILGEHTYAGNPFPLHTKMPLQQKHFDSWLELWTATIDRHFAGEKAENTKARARQLAIMFQAKLNNPLYNPEKFSK